MILSMEGVVSYLLLLFVKFRANFNTPGSRVSIKPSMEYSCRRYLTLTATYPLTGGILGNLASAGFM